MNVLYILVPVALLLAAAGVAGFIWSVRNDQFEDVETPGVRLLFDDDEVDAKVGVQVEEEPDAEDSDR